MLKRQFEPIHKKDPKILQRLHEQASAQLTKNIKEELALMFEEENIQAFMAKLDDMKAQADEMDADLVAWRPSGEPSEDVRAHVQPVYQQHLHQLQKVFDQLQSQNMLLKRSLKKEQDKLMQSHAAIQGHLQTWRKANCLTGEDCRELEAYMKKL
ncbi:polyamine-modulated factor 1-like isoform X2 [Babylonia areolata]